MSPFCRPHFVIRKHRHLAEEMIDNLQAASRAALVETVGFLVDHPVWTLGGWKRFLNSPADVQRLIPYVEQNPSAAGRPPQHWPFITTYNNWPFHKRRS